MPSTEDVHAATISGRPGDRSRWRAWGVRSVAIVAVAAVIASCGSSTSADGTSESSSQAGETGTSEQTSTVGTTAAASATCIDAAKSAVELARAPLPLVVPEKPLDVSKLAGSSFWFLNVVNIPILNRENDGFKAAAKVADASVTVIDGKGQAPIQNKAITDAVTHDANGVVITAITPATLRKSLAEAHEANIPAVEIYGSAADESVPGLTHRILLPFEKDGELMAKYALSETDCKLNALVVYQPGTTMLKDMRNGAVKAINELCPEDCTVTEVEYNVADLATKLQPRIAAALRANPDINFIIDTTDAEVPYVQAAVRSNGVVIPSIGHDGTPEATQSIRENTGQVATVAFPPHEWIGWMLFDQVARLSLGMDALPYEVPTFIVDSSNVGASDAELFPEYEGFETVFEKAWSGN
jgi:ribose transport system substrate-binding protein